jgi:Zn-dependent peptidase ImmA (M78 family)
MCKLVYVDFGQDGDVVTYYHPGKKVCVMLVNEQRALKFPKRLNFSLAHELGHLVLKHYEYLDNPDISPEKKELLEWHADEFAAQFLISDYKLMQHKRVKNSILSDYFFVSEEVIRIRKESLGIFSVKDRKPS